MSTEIILANTDRETRRQLCSIFGGRFNTEIVNEIGDGTTAVRIVGKMQPDVVVVDLMMPGINGVELARLMIAAAPGIKSVVLLTHRGTRFIAGILNTDNNQYHMINCDIHGLAAAIRDLLEPETVAVPA